MDNHQGVNIVTFQQRFDGLQITGGRRVVTQIERIVGLNALRQRLLQAGQQGVVQRGEFALSQPELVQRQCGRCRAVADNHQSLAAQRAHMA